MAKVQLCRVYVRLYCCYLLCYVGVREVHKFHVIIN
jgi:hypothetical protein